MTRTRALAGAAPVVAVLSAALLAIAGGSAGAPSGAAAAGLGVQDGVRPLAFEPNAGRFDRGLDYVAHGRGVTLAVGQAQSRLTVGRAGTLTTRLVGARAATGDRSGGARAKPERRLATRVNWYLGRDRARWRSGLPTFARVRYARVYPGIDVVYHGREGSLEYDFELAPRAEPGRIALSLRGASSLRLAANGDLVATVGERTLRQRRPVAYQRIGGKQRRVAARFVLRGRRVSFRLGRYDRTRALVIDPVLELSDYIGGSASDSGAAVAAVPGGGVVVGGTTSSTSIAGTSANPPSSPSGTVLKVARDGTREWITYLGSAVNGVAVSPTGEVYVTGSTGNGLAVTSGAADSSYGGGANDAFAAKLSPAGARSWVTYLGGGGNDIGFAITVDRSGSAYVAGETNSTETNGTGVASASGVLQNGNASVYDAFVAKYSPSGSRSFGTYVGGNSNDEAHGIGVAPGCQSNCDIFVAGFTQSTNFPATLDTTLGGPWDGFMLKLSPSGATLAWGTYDGGGGTELIYAMAMSPAGNPTMVGVSDSSGNSQAILHTFVGSTGSLGVDPQRTFGGSAGDTGKGVAYDAQGNVYMVGETLSTDLDTVAAIQPDRANSQDGFAVKWKPTSVFPVWATYLGGSGFDSALAIATDATGGGWVAGTSGSTDFPAAGGATHDPAPPDQFISNIQVKPTVIETGPEAILRASSATFTYTSGGEVGATYQCRLSPAESDFSSCPATGKTYTGLTDGAYTFEVRTRDQGGTPGMAASRAFTVDTKPVASFTIAPNPALVGATITFDGSGSAAADGAIAKFEWDLDGDGTFERDTGTTATTSQAYPGAATVPVGLRVTDALGVTSVATQQLQVNELPGGGQLGVTINNGAQFTRSPDVEVTANFPAGTTTMLFSNDGGFLAPMTFQPAKETEWKLDSSGPERLPKTIYVRFLTGAITSQTYQDDIILDEIPPKIQAAAVTAAGASSSSLVARASRRTARKRSWRVRVRATDSNSGVSKLQVTANKRKPGRKLKYRRKLKVRSAVRPRWIRARDRAGNWSRWKKARR